MLTHETLLGFICGAAESQIPQVCPELSMSPSHLQNITSAPNDLLLIAISNSVQTNVHHNGTLQRPCLYLGILFLL